MSVRSTSEMVALARKGDKLQLLVKYGVTIKQVIVAVNRVIVESKGCQGDQRILDRMVDSFLEELRSASKKS